MPANSAAEMVCMAVAKPSADLGQAISKLFAAGAPGVATVFTTQLLALPARVQPSGSGSGAADSAVTSSATMGAAISPLSFIAGLSLAWFIDQQRSMLSLGLCGRLIAAMGSSVWQPASAVPGRA
ncbi:MAG: hypothetical protein C0423_06260 [Methylibium sp.]|nr:hypothetical protein [Methylibium sp.]